MPGIAIVTDSSAGLPAELVEHYRITIVPVAILFGGEVHRDGDLTSADFYDRLANTKQAVTTAAPAPGEFLESFRGARDRGASAVLCLTLSSRFSGTHSSAVDARELAARELPGFPVLIVDTGGIAMTHGFAVLAAARAVACGANLAEAGEAAERAGAGAGLVGMLDTTHYLAKSGRVPWILHRAASLLKVKPLIAASDGKIGAVGRVRTTERGIERMVSYLERRVAADSLLRIAVMHADSPELAHELADRVAQRLAPRELILTEFTHAMAIHTGPGFLGLAWTSAARQAVAAGPRRSSQVERDAKRLAATLGPLPPAVDCPALVVLCGLPGSGKSHLAREIVRRYPLAVLESDALRKALVKRPTYSQNESRRLFSACHRVLEDVLSAGIPALLDATNLKEAHRCPLYDIAERTGAGLVLVDVVAGEDVIRGRLAGRGAASDSRDVSEATLEVYESMRSDVEPIQRSHLTVDTSSDIRPDVDRIIRELEAQQ